MQPQSSGYFVCVCGGGGGGGGTPDTPLLYCQRTGSSGCRVTLALLVAGSRCLVLLPGHFGSSGCRVTVALLFTG